MPANWVYIIEYTTTSTELRDTQYDTISNYFVSRDDAKKFLRTEMVGFHKAMVQIAEENGEDVEMKVFDNLDSMFVSSNFKVVMRHPDRSVATSYTIKPMKFYTGSSRVHDELDYDGTEEVTEEVPEV